MASNFRRAWSLLLLLALFSTFIEAKTVVLTVHTTVEAASTAQGTPTVPTPPSYTSTSDFQDTVIRVSNEYRQAHDASPLVWNDTLVQYSRKWAQTCIWKHSVRIALSFIVSTNAKLV